MKKVIICLMFVIVLAGCNVSFSFGDDSKDEPKEKEDVALQVLKVDEEAGLTIENDDFYSGLDEMLAEDPKLGTANDFSVHTIDIFNFEEGAALVLVGINRLDFPMKDVTFNFTLGDKNGETIWENEPIDLPAADVGVIQPNSAVPILMGISDAQAEELVGIDEADLYMELDDFKYEKEK